MKTQDLIGHWVHSREEDTAAETVFRPADFRFPRSRGRDSFELTPDALIERGSGPGDAATAMRGKWSVSEKDELSFFREGGKKAARVLQILSVQPDRLAIREA